MSVTAQENALAPAHRLALKIEGLRRAVFIREHLELRFALFALIGEGAALDERPALIDGVAVFLFVFAVFVVLFRLLLNDHPAAAAEVDGELRFALEALPVRFAAPFAAHRIFAAVDDEDPLDGKFLFRLFVKPIVPIVVIVIVGRKGKAVVIHHILPRLPLDIGKGDAHLRFIAFPLRSALFHGKAAVLQQTADERHVAVQFGKFSRRGGLFGLPLFGNLLPFGNLFGLPLFGNLLPFGGLFGLPLFGLLRFGVLPLFGNLLPFGGGGVYDHARRSGAESIDGSRVCRVCKISEPAAPLIRAGGNAEGERECERQSQCRKEFFHVRTLLFSSRRECPEFPCLN